MNKLPENIGVASRQAEHCVARAEFFKTKSQASYRNQAADNWQAWAERWADIEELLRELAMYRNAAMHEPHIKAHVAENMRHQGYDY